MKEVKEIKSFLESIKDSDPELISSIEFFYKSYRKMLYSIEK